MKQRYLLLTLAIGLNVASGLQAKAEDRSPTIRTDETCQSAKFVPEYGRKFKKLKADRLDSVRMIPMARLYTNDAYPHLPERVYIKDGGAITDLTLTSNGDIVDFERLLQTSEAVEICTFDPRRAGLPLAEDGLKWDIEMDIIFIEATGQHSMEILRDGLRDGRKHYKQTAGALSVLVPKMTHLMIRPMEDEASLKAVAMQGEQALTPIELDQFCGLDLVPLTQLEDLGADELHIIGGDYRLMPVPGPKALARFAGCSDDT